MIYRFETCEIDVEQHRLTVAGQARHVEPQVFDLLVLLAAEAPDLVSYDRIIAEIWQGRIVSDATLAARISAARQAVGDDGKRQAVIRTIARRGVQMVVPVQVDGAATAPRPDVSQQATPHQTIRYTTSRDGTGIAWAEMGEGPPLMRGGHWLSHLEHDLNSPMTGALLRRLSQGRRLIRYDPRGTGLSDRNVDLSAVTVKELAEDLEAVANAAGLDHFPIFAISQSVPVALTFAANHPERVARMILQNGLVQGSTVLGAPEKTEAMLALIRSGWGVPDSPFMKALATVFVPQATPEELENLVHLQSISATPEIAAQIRRIVGEIDVSASLAQVTAPALVVHHSGDAVQSPDQSKQIARGLRNAEFTLLTSANHMLLPSDPIWEPLIERIDHFLGLD